MGRIKWVPIGAHFFFAKAQTNWGYEFLLVMDIDKQKLYRICETGLMAIGYDLVELDFMRDQHGWVLRVFIDFPPSEKQDLPTNPNEAASAIAPSRITHQDCEKASRHLGTVLDVEDPIPGPYRLEMSSPGIKRPLRKESDFVRFMGHKARIVMEKPIENRKNFNGVIKSVEQGIIGIDVDGMFFSLPIEGIRRANLDVEI